MQLPNKQNGSQRYFIDTWGCQMNVHDSEKLAGSLRRLGYSPTTTEREADLIVLNTWDD